ncbi:hypothetical protein BDV97DRAFT_362285 [Delphinella strobiligena]|nr:hypothetical protein BDV97DRAFT_362285 [Delphinella strobiligena]
MYMDYADGGDLLHIIRLYTKDPPESGQVPEPYLWFTLYHLMLACKRMDDITIGKPGEVIHQDIKFNNVFLDKPDPLWFPQFPIPKMGDWGSAQFTFEGDDRNPMDWRGNDPLTRGWQPPDYRRSAIPKKLTSSINVWQSAMIIRVLMQAQLTRFAEYVTGPAPAKGFDGDTTFANYDMDVPVMDSFNGEYSQDLMDIISRCLSDKVDYRYKPQQVIDYIADNFDRFFQGAEDPGVVSNGQHQVLGATMKDHYKPGMIYQKGPKDVVTKPTTLTSARILVEPDPKPNPQPWPWLPSTSGKTKDDDGNSVRAMSLLRLLSMHDSVMLDDGEWVQATDLSRLSRTDVDLAQAMDRLGIPRSITSGDLVQAMNRLRVAFL